VDPESFEELVQARVQHLFGDSLDVVAPDPELREAVHDAVAKGLRGPKRLIPPDSLEFAARMNATGLRVTPGTSDLRDLPEALDLGCSGGHSVKQSSRIDVEIAEVARPLPKRVHVYGE